MNVRRFLVLCVVVSLLIHQCYTAVSIEGCSSDRSGKLTFDERTSTSLSLTCSGITQAVNVWEIVSQNAGGTRSSLQLANCTILKCSSAQFITTTRYFLSLGVSVLSVNGNFRNTIAGTITCGELGEQKQPSAACAVRVVYSATEHENRVIGFDNTDWTLRGSFTVVKVFASDEEYSCNWTLIGDGGTQDRSINGTVHKTPFNDGGLVFFSATCGLRIPVATVKGSYIGYRTQFSPAGVQEISTKTSFAVGPPTAPPQLINCPTRAPNSSTVSCTCKASFATPPAVVTWSSDTSQRNSEAVLELSPIDQGKKYTCLQNWGGPTGPGGPGGDNWATTYTYVYSGDDDDDDDDSVAGVYAGAAGGVLGCIAIVAGVIVIVVVWKRRIAAEETKGGAMETLASHDKRDDNPDQFDTEDMQELNDYEVPLLATANQGASAAIDMSQYSALDTRDIGQRSEYAEFSPYQNTGINRGRAGKTTRSEYSKLQREEIGVKSEYSDFSPYENSPSRIRRK